MNDGLKALWESTANLYGRFFLDNPPTFQARFDKFIEESNEFKEAVCVENETPIYALDSGRHNAVHELADTLVTGIGLLQHLGYSMDDLADAINDVVRKNGAKTLTTHYVNEVGLIARRKVE